MCPNFVSDDKPKQSSHQLFREGKALSAGVQWGRLDEVPVPEEVLDVVVELDIGFEDFSGTRIVDVGTLRIFSLGG